MHVLPQATSYSVSETASPERRKKRQTEPKHFTRLSRGHGTALLYGMTATCNPGLLLPHEKNNTANEGRDDGLDK